MVALVISFRYIVLLVTLILYIIIIFKLNIINNSEKKNLKTVDFVSSLYEPFECLGAPCSTDENCQICKINSNYSCINGKCAVKKVDVEEDLPLKKCDETKGFYLVKSDSIHNTEWICLNTKSVIYNDDGVQYKYICENGTYNPENNTCTCKNDSRFYMISTIPMCLLKTGIF